MAKIRGYIAASLDGFVADKDHGVDWLEPFTSVDYGYEQFIEEIGTVVMGRKTYDFIAPMDDWPYPGKDVVLVTHRAVDRPPPRSEVWQGEISTLANRLRNKVGGDVWIVGGSEIQSAFLKTSGLDLLEIFTMPVLLGEGVPLWPPSNEQRSAKLEASQSFANGVLHSTYSF